LELNFFAFISNKFLAGATVLLYRYGTIWPARMEIAAETLLEVMPVVDVSSLLLFACAFAWCISH
jgi:hypothetical protein